ncbi:MAG: PilC/PilY family type IV pilus protein, partial [Gammaproteobacteria bacterium]
MKKLLKSRFLKGTALLLALSAALYATIVFDPDSQPALTTAPYALQDSNLDPSGTKAYRAWYENGAWTGDLIEYDISAGGIRTTSATPVIGNFTESELISHAADSTLNWTARSRFAAKEDGVANYWQETAGGRQIFTYVDSDDDGVADTQADFLWDKLSAAQQLALDPDTVAAGLVGPYDSDTLNFIRGDRTNEKSSPGGTLRIRYSLLGDIINSWPVYVGPPTESYTISGFIDFKNTISGFPPDADPTDPRPGRIAVGANDGMLHVFDEIDGSEVWAYIPSMLLDKLDNLTAIPYTHSYYVDGKPTVRSAQVGSDDTWKTVLASGMGAGARGLFILDMTDADPDPSTDEIVMYEKTGSDFGYIYGQPSIFRLADDHWYVITGNGFGSTADAAKLLLISLYDGSVTTIDTGATGAGLAAISLVDINRDNRADYAYGGDTDGDMWKFDLTDLAALSATKIFDGDASQPITTRPEIGVHPEGGFMVLFGTGSAMSLADATDEAYPTQAIFGIWDNATSTSIVEQTLVQVDDYEFTGTAADGTPTSETENIRYISSEQAVEYTCPVGDDTCSPATDTDLGWKVELPVNERVIGPPLLRAGRVTVMTTNPTGTITDSDGALTSDLEGDSWLVTLYYLTGGDNDEIFMNLNNDGTLDDADKVNTGSVAAPDLQIPVALNMGDGNISQPALARVGPGADVLFINGLRLSLPQNPSSGGPLLSGHIDVDTDSPNTDPLAGGSTAPNSNSKHSEGYNVETSDGLGRGVDGHFHDYDTVNGISYVDVFELEPRRNLGDLTALPVDKSGDNCPAGSVEVLVDDDNDPATPKVSANRCVSAVEAELNRAFDNYGEPETTSPLAPTLEAEVFGLGSTSPLGADTPFIVVLANADLSSSGKLQIGCRVWDVVEYQDMITRQLEAGMAPDELDDCPGGAGGKNTECPGVTHGLVDNSLVFTLNSIAAGTDVTGKADLGDCSTLSEDDGLSDHPTLRIGFTTRSILDGGIHGTRAQCVLGLHDYHDKVCYSDAAVLENAAAAVSAGPDKAYSYTSCEDDAFTGSKPDGIPPAGYIRDPARNLHITESLEGDN